MQYIGIDGCRGGWLFSLLNEKEISEVKLFRSLDESLEVLKKSDIVFVDMPIGLVESIGEKREIDIQIRKELGHPFSSSVFTVPCKQAVYANDYQSANKINREVLGKGISIQAWNICPKIKELDVFLALNPDLKYKFKEKHPELCFKHIKGSSLSYKKRTKQGFEERIKLLVTKQPTIKTEFIKARNKFLKKYVADDDILDSIVLVLGIRKCWKL